MVSIPGLSVELTKPLMEVLEAMTIETTMNVIFGVATVISLIFTIYYGRRAKKLESERKSLRYEDLQSAANDLAEKINREFAPDAVFTPGLRGATIANLLVPELSKEVPVFVGISSWKHGAAASSILAHSVLETNKWLVYVPDVLLSGGFKKLLVVDDFVMSGDFLERVVGLLSANVPGAEIRAVSIVTTSVAIKNHKAPNYFWMQTTDDTFYFPWGRAR